MADRILEKVLFCIALSLSHTFVTVSFSDPCVTVTFRLIEAKVFFFVAYLLCGKCTTTHVNEVEQWWSGGLVVAVYEFAGRTF